MDCDEDGENYCYEKCDCYNSRDKKVNCLNTGAIFKYDYAFYKKDEDKCLPFLQVGCNQFGCNSDSYESDYGESANGYISNE